MLSQPPDCHDQSDETLLFHHSDDSSFAANTYASDQASPLGDRYEDMDDHTSDSRATSLLDALSPAERAVYEEALSGDSVKVVAHRLSLSQATVRSHLSAIYGKLQVDGRAHLIAEYGSAAPSARRMRVTDERRGSGAPRWPVVVAAVGLVLLAAGAISLLSAPRQESFSEVVRLAAAGELSQLRYHDATLIATTSSGEIAVRDIPIERANRLSTRYSVDLATSAYEPAWLQPFILVLPIALALLMLLLAAKLAVDALWHTRGRPIHPSR